MGILDEEERHIEMMTSPDNWPMWPLLPLKKVADGWEVGLLAEIGGEVQPIVYLSNMFAGINDRTPKLSFESFREIFDAGWRVD